MTPQTLNKFIEKLDQQMAKKNSNSLSKKKLYGNVVNKPIPENILRWMKEITPNDASTSSPNNTCTIDGNSDFDNNLEN